MSNDNQDKIQKKRTKPCLNRASLSVPTCYLFNKIFDEDTEDNRNLVLGKDQALPKGTELLPLYNGNRPNALDKWVFIAVCNIFDAYRRRELERGNIYEDSGYLFAASSIIEQMEGTPDTQIKLGANQRRILQIEESLKKLSSIEIDLTSRKADRESYFKKRQQKGSRKRFSSYYEDMAGIVPLLPIEITNDIEGKRLYRISNIPAIYSFCKDLNQVFRIEGNYFLIFREAQANQQISIQDTILFLELIRKIEIVRSNQGKEESYSKLIKRNLLDSVLLRKNQEAVPTENGTEEKQKSSYERLARCRLRKTLNSYLAQLIKAGILANSEAEIEADEMGLILPQEMTDSQNLTTDDNGQIDNALTDDNGQIDNALTDDNGQIDNAPLNEKVIQNDSG